MNPAPYPFRLSFFEKAIGGKLDGMDRMFTDISIDSRSVSASSLFVAIKGERFDGHDFIPEVISKGVTGIVVKEGHPILSTLQNPSVSQLRVANTNRSLGHMAKAYKKELNVKTLAITGSVGKTSTRELISVVLKEKYTILTPEKNFNNEIGVPLTLFRLRPTHEWAVVELGMSGFGEIARLTEICQPDIGVISNIGPAHLAGVGGTIEGVLTAKAELFKHMDPLKTAVVNVDDDFLKNYIPHIRQKVVTYGTTPDADIWAENIRSAFGKIQFDVRTQMGSEAIVISTLNQFMVLNALAAIAVGLKTGLPLKDIARGIEKFSPVQRRMAPIQTEKQILVIDDTYNANPASVSAALESLENISADRKIAVLGDMGELGEKSAELHYQMGIKAAQTKVDRLYIIGEFAQSVADGAKKAGLNEVNIFIGSYEEILSDLTASVSEKDVVLVKGSRFMEMEKIVVPFVEWANSNGHKNP